MSKTYQDFGLCLEKREHNNYTSFISDVDGQRIAQYDFTLRIDTLKMHEDLQRLEQYALSSEQVEGDFHIDFGRTLYGSAFGGDVGVLYRKRLRLARSKGKGLRILVRIAEDAAELSALPWELLHDGDGFLATRAWTPVSRLPLWIDKASHPPLTSGLRMLVVVASPRDLPDYQILNTEREQGIILEALDRLQVQRKLEIDWVEGASLATIQDRLAESDVHVLHFAGHGTFDEKRNEGFLLLEDEKGDAEETSNDKVVKLLSAYPSLRLVVLSACQSAKRSQNPGYLGLAEQLLAQGVPTVLAMQHSVRDDRASEFARRFYSSLAAGKAVDVALTEARVVLSMEGVDFATPILYMTDPNPITMRQVTPESESETVRHRPLMIWGAVPTMARGFVGRGQELREIGEGFLRGKQRAFIIHGFAGIGKSLLATQAATRLARHFVGVKAIRCTQITRPETILAELNSFLNLVRVETFNPVVYAETSLESKTDIMCNILGQVRCLVILDNFEDCLNSECRISDPAFAQFMGQLLGNVSEGTKFLITSRYDFEPLEGPGSLAGQLGHIALGELPFPMAVQIMNKFDELAKLPLTTRPQQPRIRGTDRGISKKSVYDIVGGHPYAIGILGQQARVIGVHDLLQKLEVVKQDIIEFALLEHIFQEISPQAQNLLKRASVYEDPVPFDGLIWVIDPPINELELADSVRELIKWGLLVTYQSKEDEIFFTLHTVVRDFAGRKLGETEAKKASFQAACFYYKEIALETSDEVEKMQADNERQAGEQLFRLIDQALANSPERVWDLLRARHYFARAGRHDMSSNIVMLTCDYLIRWGHVDQVMNLLTEVALTSENERERAQANLNLARVYNHFGDYDSPIQLYEDAIATYESQGDRALVAKALNNLGMVYEDRGDYEKALQAYNRSLATKLELGDKGGAINSLANISSIYKNQGNYVEALYELRRATEIVDELKDDNFRALILNHSGAVFEDIAQSQIAGRGSDPNEVEALVIARQQFESSLEHYERIGDRSGVSHMLINLGNIHRLSGNIRTAQKMFEDGLNILVEIGHKSGIAYCLMGLATIHEADGDLAASQERFGQSLAISEEIGDKQLIAYSYFGLGKAMEKQGNFVEAKQQYLAALDISAELKLPIRSDLQAGLVRVQWRQRFKNVRSKFQHIPWFGGNKQ
jgi:tetratricopeptide (TPR) repeat protein